MKGETTGGRSGHIIYGSLQTPWNCSWDQSCKYKYNCRFKCLFKPNQNMSINEQMVASKANFVLGGIWGDIWKPSLRSGGYKLVLLADPSTAYTWSVFVHEGRKLCSPQARLWAPPLMDLLPWLLLSGGYTLCGQLLFLASSRNDWVGVQVLAGLFAETKLVFLKRNNRPKK